MATPEPERDCLDDLGAFRFVQGTCSEAERASIMAHVQDCAGCTELIANIVDTGSPATRPARRGARQRSSSPSPPELGEPPRIEGPYRLGPVLAEGGMGRIYRAVDTELGRDVAIKVPRSLSPALLRRFEREVAITAKLQHPGVVTVHGAGQLADGTPFYVMRFIDGTSLEVAVRGAADATARMALVRNVLAVAETMAYVHGEGIAHRDLKPNNVLLGRFGETVIIDWGLAKQFAPSAMPTVASRDSSTFVGTDDAGIGRDDPALGGDTPDVPGSSTTQAGDVLGTPAFMSPEQAAGEPIDQRADVYALGMILRYVLTGRLALGSEDPLLGGAPAAFCRLYREATSWNRNDRPANAGVFAQALRAALAPAPPAPNHTRRRLRVLASIMAIAAVIGLGALGYDRVTTRSSGDRPKPTIATLGALPADVQMIALSPDGTRAGYAGIDRLEVRDLATNRTWTSTGRVEWPRFIQFASNDTVEYSSRDEGDSAGRRVRWDLRTGVTTPLGGSARPGWSWIGTTDAGELYTNTSTRALVLATAAGDRTLPTSGRQPVRILAISRSRRAIAYLDELGTQSARIVVVFDGGARSIASPPISDVAGLTWADEASLIYAVGSLGRNTVYRTPATEQGLKAPAVELSRVAPDRWIGALASPPGRIVASFARSTFETHLVALTSTVDRRLEPVVAAAPIAWLDDGALLVWNMATSRIEERSLDARAVPRITPVALDADPGSATRAGNVLIVSQRADPGRRIVATDLSSGKQRWTAEPGVLAFVRCAGDVAAPCVAGRMTEDGLTALHRIDPTTGVIGELVVPADDIGDIALDRQGAVLAWVVGRSRVYERPLAATAAPRLLEGELSSVHSIAFASTGGGLFATRAGHSAREVVRLRDGQVEVISQTGATVVSIIRAAPDGAHVMYRARTLTSELAELRLPSP